MEATHLVINYIIIEEELVLVGATDNLRWQWDTEDGFSGADAKTIVMTMLKGRPGTGWALQEEAAFYCSPGDPIRPLGLGFLEELFEIAWEILKAGHSQEAARERYFGKAIGDLNK